MNKIKIFVWVFITACVSSNVTTYSALSKIVEGEDILLMPISGVDEIHGYGLFGFTKKYIIENTATQLGL